MSSSKGSASVIAVYSDHQSAEEAVRKLQKEGIPMPNISIVGKDFHAVEQPLGFVTTGTVAKEGAKVGAWGGGIFGLLVGAAFVVLPGVGPLIVVGPLSAALLGGLEGAFAGAALGGLTGALLGLGVSKEKAIRYEAQIKTGKFLVTMQGEDAQIQRAKALFTANKAETVEVIGLAMAKA